MCLSFGWLENFFIWVIVVCGIIALIRLLLQFVTIQFPQAQPVLNILVQALWIGFWVAVGIAVVVFIFGLIGCLAGSFPRLR